MPTADKQLLLSSTIPKTIGGSTQQPLTKYLGEIRNREPVVDKQDDLEFSPPRPPVPKSSPPAPHSPHCENFPARKKLPAALVADWRSVPRHGLCFCLPLRWPPEPPQVDIVSRNQVRTYQKEGRRTAQRPRTVINPPPPSPCIRP